METTYLESVRKQFAYYKSLADKGLEQVNEDSLFWQYNNDSNSLANIMKHLCGNINSRWTDFLTSDGEKPWRNRESEFESFSTSKAEVLEAWEKSWALFFDTLNSLTEADLDKTIYIRNQGHSVMEAINRQLAHYPYHIGQMVYVCKMLASGWNSLSIPKGGSDAYNAEKFAQEKQKKHFTDEYLNAKKDEKSS